MGACNCIDDSALKKDMLIKTVNNNEIGIIFL